jgi:zinc transporter
MNAMPHPLERRAGLMFGFVFRHGRGVAVRDDTLADALIPAHDWVWLHLALSDHRALRFLDGFAPVSAAARAFLLGAEDRVQIYLASEGGHGVLPDLEQDFAGEDLNPGRLRFWLDGKYLITVRRHPVQAAESLREAIAQGLALAGPADGLARLQERYGELIEARLGVLGRELDRIEDAVLADREGIDGLPLGPLRRELSRHTREFAGLRSAIQRAVSGRRGPAAGPLAAHLPLLLQEAEDLGRDAADLQDRSRLLYEEIGTRISAAANRSLSALTIISTLLLPPTFIVGAFGMNVEGMPWSHDTEGFVVVIAVCLLLVALSYALLRRFRILP